MYPSIDFSWSPCHSSLFAVESVPVPGSFAVQFGDHLRYGDHLWAGNICGAVQISWVGVSMLHARSISSWRSSIYLLFWRFQRFSFYKRRELFLNIAADNWKPQASNHVMGPCRQSISGRKDLLLSLPTGVLSFSLAALLPYFFRSPFFTLCPTNWTTGSG